MTIRYLFAGIILVLVSLTVSAQDRVVYGKLTAFNRYPLENIEVVAKKSKVAVKTDSMGMFAIVCMEKDVVKIKSKAFTTVSRKVGPETDTLHINLVFMNSESNREMLIAYGHISEEELNYAMSHFQHENNDFCNYESIFELIRGKLPGVEVSTDFGGGAIYVRGSTSISSGTEALLVVDGMMTEDISWIHPCDVKKLDVIKDSQAAIYGSRGANGVVIIETRRGGN